VLAGISKEWIPRNRSGRFAIELITRATLPGNEILLTKICNQNILGHVRETRAFHSLFKGTSMRRIVAIIAGIVGMYSLSIAQSLEIGFDGGYGLPAGQQLSGANFERNNAGDYTSYEDLYSSGGKGLKVDVNATIFLYDNLGVMLSTGYSFLGVFDQKMTYYLNGGATTTELKLNRSYIPLSIGLKVKTKNASIMPGVSIAPYLFMAPGVYIPFSTGTDNYIDSTWDVTEKYSLGFGFTSGIGATLAFGDAIGFTMEINPTYAFADNTETSYTYGGQTETYIYEKNAATLPASVTTGNDRKYYSRGQPRNSFSSIALKFGVSYNFGHF
jgi:hypothetical protein